MTASPGATPESSIPPADYSDDLSPSLLEAIGGRGLFQTAVLGILLIAVYWVSLSSAVLYRWQNDADWSHGWLVPLFSLYFLYIHRGELAAAKRRTSYAGLLLLLLLLGVYFWTLWVRPITYARPLCFIGSVFSVVLFTAGWQVIRVVWFPIAFLVLSIPLPQGLYVDLTMPLRKVASWFASTVLSTVSGLETEISGVVIDYSFRGATGSLNVEQACSGMRLTMAFVTLGVAMAYLGARPVWQRVCMVASCVPIAVFCNVIRVTLTGFFQVFKDEPIGRSWSFERLSHGTPHALLGLAMLPIALGLFALVGWILSNLFVEEGEKPDDGSVELS